MLFHIFNIEQKGESEVFMFGKILTPDGTRVDPKTPGIQTIKVQGLFSPVYFLPFIQCEDLLLKDIQDTVAEVKIAEIVKRENIFNKDLPRRLTLVRATFKSKPVLSGFSSPNCKLIIPEFQNALEHFVISRKIMGPGVVEIADESIVKNATNYESVNFVKNSKFPEIQTASVAVEMHNGVISKFVYFNRNKRITIRCLIEGAPKSKDESDAHVAKDQSGLFSFLNETVKKDNPDFIIYHNIHLRSKISVRDKILCDVFSFASGTVRCRDYSIQELCSIYRINKDNGLLGDAKALIDIVDSMNALNLAKEMAEISGYLLNKCLGNCRAERIEYTLLHELYSKEYLFPTEKPKEAVKYSGGLVLNPSQGFYEDIILLLDFNSLYPSIIQEFNVCFSTIGLNDGAPPNKTDPGESFLPKILKNLVKRRRAVKDLLKNCKSQEERTILDVRQKALKLTANSIYGCLGFIGSRFCNFEMAAFITAKGREILNETRTIAEDMGMKVIYGDTDSIMIHTRYPGSLEYYDKAIQGARSLVEKINIKYSNIEIEMEKAFKKLLLYTKKKYAALVFSPSESYIETKGIDLVRRDFCEASSDLSRAVLNVMLEDKELCTLDNRCEEENLLESNETNKNNSTGSVPKRKTTVLINNTNETAERIYSICIDFYSTLFKRPIQDFTISSILSKNLDQYSNGSNLPHVNLALRLKAHKNMRYEQDDVVTYVIGEGDGPVSSRAFHPEENFRIDYQYYIKNQILPPLFRLLSVLTFIHSEKIGLIFNVKDIVSKTVQSNLTFIVPCCENVQTPSLKCAKCGERINESFYVGKVSEILQNAASKIYEGTGECLECGREYLNHLTACFYCQKDLEFKSKNQEMENLLLNIEGSFSGLNIPEIDGLLSVYSSASSYRLIDMSKYFKCD